MSDIIDRLQQVGRVPGTISPSTFTETSANAVGERSRIARFRADAVTRILEGRSNPFRIAVPTYESPGSTDATADNTETFTLAEGIEQTPVTEDVVVWLDGTYYGNPDAIDYSNNTIDVTDSGTSSTVHAYYMTGGAATLEVRKAVPSAKTGASEELFSGNLGLIHKTNQGEQPEYFSLNKSKLQPFVASDMTVDIYVDADYAVRWTDPDDDGTEPTNALLHIPVQNGRDTVTGLQSAIKADMAER
jgi:hypothetical protein